MAHWKPKGTSELGTSSGGSNRRNVVSQEKASGGIVSLQTVRRLIQESSAAMGGDEFYELELSEVIDVLLTEDKLPELEDGSGKDWKAFGAVLARGISSEKHMVVDSISLAYPLSPSENNYPLRGENVVIVNYQKKRFYISLLNLSGSPNSNVNPGLSGARSVESAEEDYIYEHFEIDDDIRRMWPHQGDSILQGRWGNSIRFGSHIIPGSHGDFTEKPDSPNILIRAGQLVDAGAFGKNGVVQNLKDSPNKPVEEDINADGSSVWITTDQSIKLDIKGSNAFSHDYMTSLQSDDQPTNGGKQIVVNSDRITFNSKQGKILGFSHDGIGFSTQKSFSVDADAGMKMNSGGATSMGMVPGGISLVTPGNSRLDLGGGGEGTADKILLSSECPSFLTLDDKAHLESCDGAIVHLDDCAGIIDNQGSFIRIGGKAQGVTGYVFGRDDMGQQHLVYGEELTNLMDSICNSFVELGETILNLAGIPTGAGPSGPVRADPAGANVMAVEAWVAGVETIRARLCDLLMKPEE